MRSHIHHLVLNIKRQVVHPLTREVVTPDNLPPPTTRWTPKHKATMVTAIETGLISLPRAFAVYGITIDEYMIWRANVVRDGIDGLKVTRIQKNKRKNHNSSTSSSRDA